VLAGLHRQLRVSGRRETAGPAVDSGLERKAVPTCVHLWRTWLCIGTRTPTGVDLSAARLLHGAVFRAGQIRAAVLTPPPVTWTATQLVRLNIYCVDGPLFRRLHRN
jgi:hypothetical protein